ncbi:M20/M25/M40 family metallo-hydrolase [Aquimarina sp. 2-A2]|uniref:M20/M25/M40 family metallo-hydrolase n=1 Tax=Aquimarina sp. 2-A2 TaxID=3382644 RepID=UPI00387F1C28
MKKILYILSFILILLFAGYTLYSSKPQNISDFDSPEEAFSTYRALEHVKKISKEPHYLGSLAHEDVKSYILTELKKLGLSPEIQEGFAVNEDGKLSKPQNILARIKGASGDKALLLLSHYDSSPHSANGASDAGSGVATILEGLRAFQAQGITLKNDIIICFTDGEELGLNGANLFVSKHPWAKDVSLALNFEARGSCGDSFMLVETNGGTGSLIAEFEKANPEFPVTNSLVYSVYKLLPNDTDLTILRKQKDIDGFNFAFIGDHFNYHTAGDTWEHLDLNTLEHQGSYLMPLIAYFATADLSKLKSEDDVVFFNVPELNIIKYPSFWIYPMLGAAILIFVALIIYGKTKSRINLQELPTAFLAAVISIGLAGGLGVGLFKVLTILYPGYNEILQGFTFNGYYYIVAVVLIGIAAFFKVYSIFEDSQELPSIMIVPLFFWMLICGAAAFFLEGASYFIILVYFGLLSLFVMIHVKKPFPILILIFCLPAIFILTPFIATFPVALGLKFLFISSVLTVLLCMLLLPVVGYYIKKGLVGSIAFLGALGCIGFAHFYADFDTDNPKPNSLVYILNEDQNKGYWASYDYVLDPWTQNYIDSDANQIKRWHQDTLTSMYNNVFTYINQAPLTVLKSSQVETVFDSIEGTTRYLRVLIKPQRKINRIDLFVASSFKFDNLQANGVRPLDYTDGKDSRVYNAFTSRQSNRLLTYYMRDNEPLELNMKFQKDRSPTFVMYESSYDLLANEDLSIPERDAAMIPKPFVLNDAVIVKKTIKLEYSEKKKDTISLENLRT